VAEGRAPDGIEQLKHYYRGVGPHWFERPSGGAFGIGVSRTIMQAYKDLSLAYTEGDRIFMVGFSRGAYTARALTGVIARCGLLQHAHARRAGEPTDPNLAADDPILAAYQHWTQRPRDAAERRQLQDAIGLFRAAYTRPAHVAFLGVWDTVGVLGIPGRVFQRFNQYLFQLVDRELSLIVDRAYQALAVDEHREDYAATLWERRADPRQMMEQCWFAGDHCDVGGGHKLPVGAARLADIPLAWMQERARAAGLTLAAAHPNLAACAAVACHDTYAEFLRGTWAASHPRYLRAIGATPDGHETVHPTVLERRLADPRYRPENPGLPPM
jgi:uncharacterized protein (DUF2235 family)